MYKQPKKTVVKRSYKISGNVAGNDCVIKSDCFSWLNLIISVLLRCIDNLADAALESMPTKDLRKPSLHYQLLSIPEKLIAALLCTIA